MNSIKGQLSHCLLNCLFGAVTYCKHVWEAGSLTAKAVSEMCIEKPSEPPPLWSSGQSSRLHNGDVMCFLWGTNWIYICYVEESRPPLWSNGQSSWLQIQRSGFNSRRYQIILRSSGSGTESTQHREHNWGDTCKKKYQLLSRNPIILP
jgi:hypothetical protein